MQWIAEEQPGDNLVGLAINGDFDDRHAPAADRIRRDSVENGARDSFIALNCYRKSLRSFVGGRPWRWTIRAREKCHAIRRDVASARKERLRIGVARKGACDDVADVIGWVQHELVPIG